jgi:biopolymer transport protein ExbD
MRKNRSFIKKEPLKEDMQLQITSMADIFTILLVFLLKSFSTGINNVTPANELLRPEARASDQVKEAMKLEISQNVILIDEQPVTTLNNFGLDATDVESDGTLRSLNVAFTREKAKRDPASSDYEATKLMILADQRTPYGTLRSVLDSAGHNGFVDFKLVVVEDR